MCICVVVTVCVCVCVCVCLCTCMCIAASFVCAGACTLREYVSTIVCMHAIETALDVT